jgi:hypothetical protein
MVEGLPRVVWTLWLQGWETAPPLVQACLRSWQRRNPTWTVRTLTRDNISQYLDLLSTYPDVNLDQIPAAALSDMIRIALLSQHGGVWADSTVFCVMPLDRWIDDYSRTGFFAFARPGPDRMLSSWFLASEPHHPLTVELRDRVREYWQDRSTADHYFWFHRLFSEAYRTQDTFREVWDATPEIRSDGPHYFVPYRTRLAGKMTHRARARILSGADPVYKLTHRAQFSSPDPRSAYAFFNQWAESPASPQYNGQSSGPRFILVADRVSEKVRWTCRHAVTALRTELADRLRDARVPGLAEGLTIRDQMVHILRQRSE